MVDDIARELRAAHRAQKTGTARRQRAVMAAKDAGWSNYRIAKAMGATESTVKAVVKAAAKQNGDPS